MLSVGMETELHLFCITSCKHAVVKMWVANWEFMNKGEQETRGYTYIRISSYSTNSRNKPKYKYYDKG